MLTRLRFDFSHLHEHKLRYCFTDTLNSLYYRSIEAKTTTHYFLRYHFFNANETILINDLEIFPFVFLGLVTTA